MFLLRGHAGDSAIFAISDPLASRLALLATNAGDAPESLVDALLGYRDQVCLKTRPLKHEER